MEEKLFTIASIITNTMTNIIVLATEERIFELIFTLSSAITMSRVRIIIVTLKLFVTNKFYLFLVDLI